MTVTPFQQRVYEAVLKISRGRVATYKSVADAIGCGAPRAVGQALRNNPFAPRVPCHRVIAADLTPGGFHGEAAGPSRKRKLMMLAAEGIRFEAGKLADRKRLFVFTRKG